MSAEQRVLQPHDLPEVPRKPAPWALRARAYLLMLRMPEAFDDARAFVPPSLMGRRHGRIAYAMAVDYEHAACGPYQELLFAPVFRFADTKHASITRIYVSTYDSVVNGRLNWGIPKDQAAASFQSLDARTDEVSFLRDGRAFATLRFEHYGPRLPVFSAVLPTSLRTLVQHWCGNEYRVLLSGKGSMQLATLRSCQIDPAMFPDLSAAQVLAAVYMPSVELAFPVAEVRAL